VTHTREPLPTHVRGLPPLPAAYQATVDEGLAAIGIDLSRAAREAIDDHLRLLLAWTRAINLTAIRDPVAAAKLHVLDSLSAVPLLRSLGAARYIDLGSGGGYPAVPLAVALPAEALLVESIAKKARFLELAVAVAGLVGRVDVATTRAEAISRDPAHRGRWPVVTARAVAPLGDLIELGLPLLPVGGALVAWKRRPGDPSDAAFERELEVAARASAAIGGSAPEVIGVALAGLERHRLVIVRKVRPSPEMYPRDAALRGRQPW
jgi:16S rRNA (guanine527-N7)-methyltransferase